MVNTSSSSAGGAGLIPGPGVRVPCASGQKAEHKQQKQYCNKFNKDFKMTHIKEYIKKNHSGQITAAHVRKKQSMNPIKSWAIDPEVRY